jgi:gas vesicle protein
MADRGGPSFVAGIVVGAVTGAALATLLAPWSGEETRDVLRAKSREATNLARDTAADAIDGLRHTIDAAVGEGKTAAERQRAALEATQRQ